MSRNARDIQKTAARETNLHVNRALKRNFYATVKVIAVSSVGTFDVHIVVQFILGLIYIFFCFKLVIIHYHTKKQKKK